MLAPDKDLLARGQFSDFYTTKTVNTKGAASLTDTVASPARLNI